MEDGRQGIGIYGATTRECAARMETTSDENTRENEHKGNVNMSCKLYLLFMPSVIFVQELAQV